MSENIYGVPNALAIFEKAGAKMTRQNFYQSIMPHLKDSGFARNVGGGRAGVWEFDLRYLQHWARYVAEVRKRQTEGKLPGNYKFSESDMQFYADGAWDAF